MENRSLRWASPVTRVSSVPSRHPNKQLTVKGPLLPAGLPGQRHDAGHVSRSARWGMHLVSASPVAASTSRPRCVARAPRWYTIPYLCIRRDATLIQAAFFSPLAFAFVLLLPFQSPAALWVCRLRGLLHARVGPGRMREPAKGDVFFFFAPTRCFLYLFAAAAYAMGTISGYCCAAAADRVGGCSAGLAVSQAAHGGFESRRFSHLNSKARVSFIRADC